VKLHIKFCIKVLNSE